MKILIRAVVGLMLMLTLAIVILLFSGVSIPVDFLDSRLEALASRLLNRPVTIHGPVKIKPSLQPRLDLGGLVIGNPQGWPQDEKQLLRVERSHAQISLTDLFKGRLRIIDLAFGDAHIQLVRRADGSGNYRFSDINMPERTGASDPDGHELSGLDRLSLTNIRLTYTDEATRHSYSFVVDEARGQGKADENLVFSMAGKLFGQPLSLLFTGGTLRDLISGAGSWPLVEGKLNLAGSVLALQGAVNWAAQDRAGYLSVALSGSGLSELGEGLKRPLPDIGSYLVEARISVLPGMMKFTGLEVSSSKLDQPVHGDLVLAFGEQRPQLSGNLTIDGMDLTHFAGSAHQEGSETRQTSAEQQKPPAAEVGEAGGSRPAIAWHLLEAIDSDIHIRANSIGWGEKQIGDLQAVVSIVDGDMVIPVSATAMDIPLKMQLGVNPGGSQPSIELDLSSPGASLDPLLSVLPGELGMRGQLGALSLRGETSGETLLELLEGIDLRLLLGPAQLFRKEDLLLGTEALSLEYKHQRSFQLSTRGTLLGQPLEAETLIGARPLSDDPEKSTVHMQLTACGSELLFEAGRSQRQQGEINFNLQAEGKGLCGLAGPVERFIGLEPGYSISTTGILEEKSLRFDIDRFRLDVMDLNGRLELRVDEYDQPLITGLIRSERIDLPVLLEDFKPQAAPGEHSVQEDILEQRIALLKEMLAWQMLPLHKYLTTDAELDIEVGELLTDTVRINDIELNLKVRDGRLERSPFRADIGKERFTGSAAVDTASTTPVVHLGLASENFNLAELLKELGIEQAPDISIGRIGADLELPGHNLQEMLLQARYELEIREGRWVHPREVIDDLITNIKHFTLIIEPEKPVQIVLAGDINTLPLNITMRGDGLFAKQTREPIILDLDIALADADLEFEGKINRLEEEQLGIALSSLLSGARMSSLNELFGINLPPFGPYRIGAALTTEKGQISLRNLQIRVGDSRLKGELVALLSEDTPKGDDALIDLQTRLTAETVQLNDFRSDGWSPLSGTVPDSSVDSAEKDEQNEAATNLYSLFSRELGEKISGSFEVKVQEVLSGSDKLGGGLLKASVEQGHYRLDTLKIELPGGSIQLDGSYLPEVGQTSAELRMQMKNFDYGILARRIKTDSELKGEVNLDVDLHSSAPDAVRLSENLNGRFRFGVRPVHYQAGIIDLWAVNILTAALPALLSGNSSEVNCLAGDFSVEQGLMAPEVFLLDTSRMRVNGKGTVDLKTNTIDFYLKPTPKSASFFSLATPIAVSGSIFQPEISPASGAVLKTLFRQVTSVVTVPFQWLFTENLETSGAKACSAAMQWVLADDAQ
ncbi:MAG: AsmA family protein [Desulfocapsaceae bacterium]